MRKINYSQNLDIDKILNREGDPGSSVEDQVKDIINNVRANGDKALQEYSNLFDKVNIKDFRVDRNEIDEAYTLVEPELIEIFQDAANNIKDFHEKQKEETWIYEAREGVRLGQQITPISEVGMYVPGGKAAYPSTVLMDAIPAKVAGVERLVMVTPPSRNGKINPHILVAADIAGVDEIYKTGGAQAIAALAYGTETINPVNKIVGPGNIYVATAKKEVFGKVAIDMIAGPSEVLIIADSSADPNYIAADLLSQAEHDELASPLLITTDKSIGFEVEKALEKQLDQLDRKEITRQAIDNNGIIFLVDNIDQAFELANDIAPEHLELLIINPEDNFSKVKNAGAIFIGENTPEPVGDYFAGPNHTLPTSGTAKFSSPLGVYDFQKRTSLLNYSKTALEKVGQDIEKFARSEGLDAHANSIDVRLNN